MSGDIVLDRVLTAFLDRIAREAVGEWGEEEERAVQVLVALLRANKFPLLALEGARTLQERSESWRRALERDRREMEGQRSEYLRVKEAWAREGIPCIAFKSAGIYPSFPYTSDNLDLLVPRASVGRARALLEDLGYVWLRNIDEPQKFLFRRFVGGRSVLAVHVHSWVGWDVEFLDNASLWRRARPAPDDPEVTVPSAEDAILVNVAHALYENKRFTLYDLHKVSACWSGPALDWRYVESQARRRGWHDGLLLGLLVCSHMERELLGATMAPPEQRQHWEEGLRRYRWARAYWRRASRRPLTLPFPVSFSLSKLLYYRKVLADGEIPPGQRVTDLARVLAWGAKLKSGLRPQPGFLVSLSGLDGAGKTTVARALGSALAISELRGRLVWTRCGCSRPYRLASSLLRRWGVTAAQGEEGDWRPAPGPPLVRTLWAWANALDVLLSLLVRAWLPRLLGQVVVSDRYSYDAAVELLSRLPPGPSWASLAPELLLRLVPRPDMAYLLDVPAETAQTRSREPLPRDVLAAQRQLYLGLAGRYGLSVVDAARPGSQPCDQVTREVLRAYEDRFRTVLAALFLSNPSQLNPSDPAARTPARRRR